MSEIILFNPSLFDFETLFTEILLAFVVLLAYLIFTEKGSLSYKLFALPYVVQASLYFTNLVFQIPRADLVPIIRGMTLATFIFMNAYILIKRWRVKHVH